MAEPGRRWPTPIEWASIGFALAAFVVSVLSYVVSKEGLEVSREAEKAQQEHLAIQCDFPTDIEPRGIM